MSMPASTNAAAAVAADRAASRVLSVRAARARLPACNEAVRARSPARATPQALQQARTSSATRDTMPARQRGNVPPTLSLGLPRQQQLLPCLVCACDAMLLLRERCARLLGRCKHASVGVLFVGVMVVPWRGVATRRRRSRGEASYSPPWVRVTTIHMTAAAPAAPMFPGCVTARCVCPAAAKATDRGFHHCHWRVPA